VLGFNPINGEATVVTNVYFPGHDGKGEPVAMSDPDELFLLSEALNVVDRYPTTDVTFVIRPPVFHEVADVLDINAGAWDLPESGVGGLTASTRLSFVTSLLEELASEARSQLSNLTGLFSLLG
jgi:hypothetical protein